MSNQLAIRDDMSLSEMGQILVKSCSFCGEPFTRQPNHPNQRYCSRSCASKGWRKENPEKARETTRNNNIKWRRENPDKYLRSAWGFKGIAPEDMGLALELWNGPRWCHICGRTETKFVIDHDHETGRVRGLLCDDCNLAIGRLFDSVENTTNAAAYLLAHRRN